MIKKLLLSLEDNITKYQNSITNPIIYNILEWFIDFVKLFFSENNHKKVFFKGDIYLIDLWINIWSELNKKRPCIIYSNDEVNRWDCIVVLPLKTLKQEKINNFSIIIKPENNWLELLSYTNITDIRSVSKKRISKFIWKLWLDDLRIIDTKITKYFIKQKSAK